MTAIATLAPPRFGLAGGAVAGRRRAGLPARLHRGARWPSTACSTSADRTRSAPTRRSRGSCASAAAGCAAARRRASSTWPTTPAGPRPPRAAGSASQTIAVDSIVGTTDPHKAAAFDRELPPSPVEPRALEAAVRHRPARNAAAAGLRLPGRRPALPARRPPPGVRGPRARRRRDRRAGRRAPAQRRRTRTASGSPEAASQARGVGLEPTTLRLTAECSAIELPPKA